VNHSGVRFAESQDAADFCAQADRRATSVALLDALTAYARDLQEAELIWRTGHIPGQDAQTSEEWLFRAATRNFPVWPQDLPWHVSADWAVRVQHRLVI